jgi:hypothetical protein
MWGDVVMLSSLGCRRAENGIEQMAAQSGPVAPEAYQALSLKVSRFFVRIPTLQIPRGESRTD